MNFYKVLMTALICSAMIFAADTTGGMNKSKRGSDGGMKDTTTMMKAMGTIEEINTTDSTFTLKTETGKIDTIYYDSKTKMAKMTLKKGEKVKVHYEMMNGKKMAVHIGPAHKGTGAREGGTPDTMNKNKSKQY